MTDLTTTATPEKATTDSGRVISNIAWAIALLLIGGLAMSTESDLTAAQSAPQQAAAAAIGCFRIVGVYTVARAIHALCR